MNVDPILQQFDSPRTAAIVARMLTVDGFPAIAETGTLRGDTATVVGALAPHPYFKYTTVLASLMTFLPDDELEFMYTSMKDTPVPTEMVQFTDETRATGVAALRLALTAMFDQPDPADTWKASR